MSTYNTTNSYRRETHPWPHYVPNDANKLILGTFPTAEKNRGAFDFYYPNPNNDFWKIIFEIAQESTSKFKINDLVTERKQILQKLRIGIGDIGKEILRQKNNSKDEGLFPLVFTDIFAILEAHPTIQKIILTSSSGCNSALAWFKQYCMLNQIDIKIKNKKLPMKSQFRLNERQIDIDIVSSTSRLSPIKGERLFAMYKQAILY